MRATYQRPVADPHSRSSAELTAEEITALRRVERKGAKLAKKLERDAEKLVAATAASSSAASVLSGSAPGTPTTATATVTLDAGEPTDARDEDGAGGETTGPATAADTKGKAKADEEADRGRAAVEADDVLEETHEAPPEEWQLDAEHSQLQPEEAFFLSFALGTLALVRPDPSPISSSSDPSPSSNAARRLSILETFRLFLESAAAAPVAVPRSPPTALLDPRLNRLDSPFLLSYAAYHHFRSMGWVARSGTKFCVDWVLYGQGGPVGGHAEYVTRGFTGGPSAIID